MHYPWEIGLKAYGDKIQWLPYNKENETIVLEKYTHCLNNRVPAEVLYRPRYRGDDPPDGGTGIFRYAGPAWSRNSCLHFEGETTANSFEEAMRFFSYRASKSCFNRVGMAKLEKAYIWRES